MAKRKTGIQGFQNNSLLPFSMVGHTWYATSGSVYQIFIPLINFDSYTNISADSRLNMSSSTFSETGVNIQIAPDANLPDGVYEISFFNKVYGSENLASQLRFVYIEIDNTLTAQEVNDRNLSYFDYTYISKLPPSGSNMSGKIVKSSETFKDYIYDSDINKWVSLQEFEMTFTEQGRVSNNEFLRINNLRTSLNLGYPISSSEILLTRLNYSRASNGILNPGSININCVTVLPSLLQGALVNIPSNEFIGEENILSAGNKVVFTSSNSFISPQWQGAQTSNLLITIKYREIWS